jgi:hypothetical protein
VVMYFSADVAPRILPEQENVNRTSSCPTFMIYKNLVFAKRVSKVITVQW